MLRSSSHSSSSESSNFDDVEYDSPKSRSKQQKRQKQNGVLAAAIRQAAKLQEELSKVRSQHSVVLKQAAELQRSSEGHKIASKEQRYENIQLKKEVAALKAQKAEQATKTRASLAALRESLTTAENLAITKIREVDAIAKEMRLLLLNLQRHIQRGYHCGPSHTALTLLDELFACLGAWGSGTSKKNNLSRKEWWGQTVQAAKQGAEEEMRQSLNYANQQGAFQNADEDTVRSLASQEEEVLIPGLTEPHDTTHLPEQVQRLITEYRLALIKLKAKLGSTNKLLKRERDQRRELALKVQHLEEDSARFGVEKEVVVSKVLALQKDNVQFEEALKRVSLENERLEERCRHHEHTLSMVLAQPTAPPPPTVGHVAFYNPPSTGFGQMGPPSAPSFGSTNPYHHIVHDSKEYQTNKPRQSYSSQNHVHTRNTRNRECCDCCSEERLEKEVSVLNRDIEGLRDSLVKAALDHTKQVLHEAVESVGKDIK